MQDMLCLRHGLVATRAHVEFRKTQLSNDTCCSKHALVVVCASHKLKVIARSAAKRGAHKGISAGALTFAVFACVNQIRTTYRLRLSYVLGRFYTDKATDSCTSAFPYAAQAWERTMKKG